jgi:GNAT superfamily N-acetyltransferase
MPSEPAFSIDAVRSREQLLATVDLFEEYAASLPIDLSYQNFDDELARLPAVYAPPTGEIFLATDLRSQMPIGCIALRHLMLPNVTRCCEIKRLYVRTEVRGKGVGRALVVQALEAALKLGYRQARLDTLLSMDAARQMYKSMGFVECERYYDTPIAETAFYSKTLGPGQPVSGENENR